MITKNSPVSRPTYDSPDHGAFEEISLLLGEMFSKLVEYKRLWNV